MVLQRRGKEEEETVVLYFDSWPKEERCIILPLKQVSSLEDHTVVEKNHCKILNLQAMVVRGVKPALVSLYDYYDKNEK